MLNAFGEQNWWPADSSFEVIIGAILTQQTTWKNVKKAITNLKNAGLLEPSLLYSIDLKSLEQLIKPSGFYRIKAQRLKNFLDYFIKEYEGKVEEMAQNATLKIRNELLNINGIGKETADSILLYALNKEIFVIDEYTKRIFYRLGVIDTHDYEKLREIFEDSLREKVPTNTVNNFKEMHALIVELGKNYCKKIPMCNSCPLFSSCQRRGVTNEYSWN
jgi:endonuclease-3 related protein